MNETEHDRLVNALCNPALYPCGARPVHLVRTHISSVLLTGPYVYKLKRPVDYGFLDFTRLRDREHYCREELRLNRRLAPGMYVDVVPIYGSVDAPHFRPEGPVLEYAVQMVQLPHWPRDWAALPGAAARLDTLAQLLARFHGRVPRADVTAPYARPEAITQHALDNFRSLLPRISGEDAARARRIEAWTRARCEHQRAAFEHRRAEGYVRECHGDLHLGNVALVHGAPRVFDCIEFDPGLRWIDVANELAFLLMDLVVQGHQDHATSVLNVYLSDTGDYGTMAVLDDYFAYRAMVRAKVSALSDPSAAGWRPYLACAERARGDGQGAILLTCGVSGSGKSYISRQLLAPLGAVRMRSDVERARLLGDIPNAGLDAGRYSAAATARTYDHLAQHAGAMAAAGHLALVDATFLQRTQRQRFYALARERGVPCVVLHFDAAPARLRERVAARAQRGTDPSEATLQVLERQLVRIEPPAADEPRIAIRSDEAVSIANILEQLRAHGISAHRYLGAG